MSTSVSMNLKFNKNSNYSITKIIEMFLEIGWRLENKSGQISFLPLGDDDDFDWQEEKITQEELLGIVSRKEQSAELIGLIFYWNDSDVGITLLGENAENVTLSLEINRKKLWEDIGAVTDFNWYIERTIVKLRAAQYEVENFRIEEY